MLDEFCYVSDGWFNQSTDRLAKKKICPEKWTWQACQEDKNLVIIDLANIRKKPMDFATSFFNISISFPLQPSILQECLGSINPTSPQLQVGIRATL